MNKILFFEIQFCSPIPFILLHDEKAINQFTSRFFYKDSLIYFICKVKKVRFDMKSISINKDVINLSLIFNKKVIPVKFCIVRDREVKLLEGSTNKLLLIDIEGYDAENPMKITPDLVLRNSKIEIGNKPQLIYIGYSFKPIRRLLNHEKIIKASAEIEDDDELRLYVSSFKFSFCYLKEKKKLVCISDIGIQKDVTSDEQLKEYVMLVERILINYFQTEGLNDKHVDMDINKDRLFKKILKKNGVRFIGGGYEMEDGEYFDFLSKHIDSSEKHFYLDYENIKDGYLTHDEIMDRFLNG
ncbi:hypothetical protein [Flavobacterium chilense]|uniref:Uncharacterized protein n=1 Tax=Flavobacterium chilense TaxID=946677 RepID=A0A1M7EXJ9_9FLAO|nr:hypothetical protein [Flavobacterium chilense]SHL96440.1 hypothetical protein SAMN05444484_103127 [Flavobacterium chilense]